jgi:hypothetical protein
MCSLNRIIAAVSLFCLLPNAGFCAVLVTGEGMAPIDGRDVEQVRYEAIASARLHALESLGIRVTARTYADSKSILDQVVMQEVAGRIVGEVVLEDRVSDGLRWIRIQALVDTVLSDTDAARQRRQLVVALDIHEEIAHEDGKATVNEARIVQETLKQALSQQGYEVYTLRDIKEFRRVNAAAGQFFGQSGGASSLTDWTMAALFITGEVGAQFTEAGPEVEDYFGQLQRQHWYRAFPRVTVQRIHAGPLQEGSVFIAEGVKEVQLSPVRAARKALVKCGEEVSSRLMTAINNYAAKNEITFSVEVEGIPSLSQYRRFKFIFSNLKWVSRVDADETFESGQRAVYKVTYREKPFLLASQLHRIPRIRVDAIVSGYNVKATYESR